ncbi:hypothetical protein V1478_006343 [Vespula squamosa]|uniref:Uncharacterized protein n=1 Tax=Vespula squamosa TaxID=30214 RepID=A0ABD2B7K5_VESSQ
MVTNVTDLTGKPPAALPSLSGFNSSVIIGEYVTASHYSETYDCRLTKSLIEKLVAKVQLGEVEQSREARF